MYTFFLNKTIREATEVTLVSVQDISMQNSALFRFINSPTHFYLVELCCSWFSPMGVLFTISPYCASVILTNIISISRVFITAVFPDSKCRQAYLKKIYVTFD